ASDNTYYTSQHRSFKIIPDSLITCFEMLVERPVNDGEWTTNNITNTDDPKLDALIDRYRESLDEQERIRLSHAIQNKIHDICAYVPTFMVPYVRIAYWQWLQLPEGYGTRMSQDLFDPFSATVGGLFWLDQKVFDHTVSAMKQDAGLPAKTIRDTRFQVVGDVP
ncbi:MAG: hypothetical protein R6V15_13465, partial [Desulfotignum sp.]